MPFPLIPIVGAGLSALGNVLASNSAAKTAAAQQKQQQANTAFDQLGTASDAQSRLDKEAQARANQNMMSPARQQILQALASRLGIQGGVQFGPQTPVAPAVNPQGTYLAHAGTPAQQGALAGPGAGTYGSVNTGQTPAQNADRALLAEWEQRKAGGPTPQLAQFWQQNKAAIVAARQRLGVS